MNSKKKGREFFEKLSEVEQEVLKKIIKVEDTPKRLLTVTSKETQDKLKEIIEKNAGKWEENDN